MSNGLSSHVWIGLLLLLTVFSFACSDEEPEIRNAPVINPDSLFLGIDDPNDVAWGETLKRHLASDPSNLNPVFVRTEGELDIVGLLNDSLWNDGPHGELVVAEHLVASYDVSPDHRVVEVELIPGNTWHDGVAFTAHDVAFSFETHRDSKGLRGPPLESVEALSETRLRYVAKTQGPAIMWDCSFTLVPRHAYDSETFDSMPIGLGPYRLVSRDPNHIRLERWEGYRGRIPAFREVVYSVIKDPTVAYEALKRGDIDVLALDAEQWRKAKDDDSGLVLTSAVEDTFRYVMWNVRRPLFSDIRVRRALAHVFDFDTFNERYVNGMANRCTGPWYAESSVYNSEVKPLEYDLDRAKTLLDEAGFRVEPSSGLRSKEGLRFEFELLYPAEGSGLGAKLAEYYCSLLEEVSIKAKVKLIPFATFLDLRDRGEFDSLLMALSGSADPLFSEDLFGTMGDGNAGGFSDSLLDELFARGRSVFELDARRAIYKQIHAEVYAQQPMLFLTNNAAHWAMKPSLRGFSFAARGSINHYPGHLAWWMPRSGDRGSAANSPVSFDRLCASFGRGALQYWPSWKEFAKEVGWRVSSIH